MSIWLCFFFLGGFFVDIRIEFGKKIKALRARSGISQELLAYRSKLDRTYISGVERGERNISILNIERIASALNVSIEYIFSEERFSSNPAYLQKDFTVPFLDRFKYQLDCDAIVGTAITIWHTPNSNQLGLFKYLDY
jgi:transcriptional regulator with XRE-family HTH domain